MAAVSQVTSDHDRIREWTEERQGKPARATGNSKGDDCLLRIEFADYDRDAQVQDITWEEFFEEFDAEKLALMYQEDTKGGKPSRFSRLVRRETVEKCP